MSWMMTCEGKLVNLDRVDAIRILSPNDEEPLWQVAADFAGDAYETLFYAATEAAAKDRINDIWSALQAGKL